MQELIGHSLGCYHILEPLGEGEWRWCTRPAIPTKLLDEVVTVYRGSGEINHRVSTAFQEKKDLTSVEA